jgi:hypothetical protein
MVEDRRETVPSWEPFPSTLCRQVAYLDHVRRLETITPAEGNLTMR